MPSPAPTDLWPAVYDLRLAESVADLGLVAGPQDAPPREESALPAWAREWASRARDALARADTMVGSPIATVRRRAGVIADALQGGARRILRRLRSGIEYVQNRGARQLAVDAVEGVVRGAVRVASAVGGTLLGSPEGTLLLLGLLWFLKG